MNYDGALSDFGSEAEQNAENANQEQNAGSGLEASFETVVARPSGVNNRESDDDYAPPPKKTGGRQPGHKNIKMVPFREFATPQEFEQWFTAEENEKWRKTSYNSKKFIADSYVCKYYVSRTNAHNCPAKLKVIYDEFSEAIIVLMSETAHDHIAADAVKPIKQIGVMEVIASLIERQYTALEILLEIQTHHKEFQVPSQVTIENLISREREKAARNERLLKTNDLLEYAQRNSAKPNDPNKFYVTGCDVLDDDNDYRWYWVVTTPRLLNMLHTQKMLQTDATQTNRWGSAKVHIFGFSDTEHHFFPCAIGVSTSECEANYSGMFNALFPPGTDDDSKPSFVLGDGNFGITNASRSVFPLARRLMCWAHVYRNVKQRLRKLSVPEDTKKQIFDDICKLKVADSDSIFLAAGSLMTENWCEHWPECEEVAAFITYFQNVWFDSPLKHWYEGSAPVIVNNNGLESANKTLQNLRIFRRKMPFRDFVTALQKVVENWSTKPEYQEPQQEY